MKNDNLIDAIKSAIEDGNHEEARTLLRVALKEPTAEVYYLASQVALNEQQRLSFLNKASSIESGNSLFDINRVSNDKTPTKPRSRKMNQSARSNSNITYRKVVNGILWGVLFFSVGYIVTYALLGEADFKGIMQLDSYYLASIYIILPWFIAGYFQKGQKGNPFDVFLVALLFGVIGMLLGGWIDMIEDMHQFGRQWKPSAMAIGFNVGTGLYAIIWVVIKTIRNQRDKSA